MASTEKEDKSQTRIPFLVQIYGENINKKHKLSGSLMTIGRNPKSNIKIDSLNVSRSHSTLQCSEGKWSIKDNNSQNGTFINGRQIDKDQFFLLQIGDIIFLGPPSENPAAFVFDDYLEETEQNSLGPEKEFCSSVEYIDTNPSSTVTKPVEIGEVPRKRYKVDVSTSSDKVPNVAGLMDPSDGSSTRQQKGKSKTLLNSALKDKELNIPSTSNYFASSSKSLLPKPEITSNGTQKNNTNSKDIQVEEISQSLLDAESGDLLSQDHYPFSLLLDESTSEKDPVVKMEVEAAVPLQDVDNEALKSKLVLLTEEIKQLQMSKSDLLKEYSNMCEKNKLLDQKLVEQQKLKEDMQMCELRIKNKFKTQIMEKLEEELICNICTEVLIKPTVLDCSHTFCEHCILQWKKKKGQCPVCRNHIKSQTRVLALDHFIDKTLETLTPGQKEKRNILMFEREQAKNQPKQKRRKSGGRRGRRASSIRRGPVPSISIPIVVQSPHMHSAESERSIINFDDLRTYFQRPVVEIMDITRTPAVPQRLTAPRVNPAPSVYVPEILLSSDSDNSSGNDMFADPCYNCGRYGHVRYECPG